MGDTQITSSNKVARDKRIRRLALLFLVLFASVTLAIMCARYFAAQMVADINRAPPLVQIRKQAKLLLAQRSDNVIADDYLGLVLPPNLEQQVETYDFEFERITDDNGFVNRGTWPSKADFVFLGDSLIMAEGVGLANGFVEQINESLDGKATVNLGSPGAGLERQFRIFEKFGAELSPSLVVACFVVSSDLTNDTQFLEWLEEPLGLTCNRFRLSDARRKDARSKKNIMRRIEGHVLYHWAMSVIEPRLWADLEIQHRAEIADGAVVLFNRETVKFAKRAFDGSEIEFENFRASLDRLSSAVRDSGAELAFVLIPSKEELFAENVIARQDSATAIVENELSSRGIHFLNLYPILLDAATERSPYFQRDPHLNSFGNRVIAETFVQWLREYPSSTGP